MRKEYVGVTAQMKGTQKKVNDFYSLCLMKICEPKKYAILMIKRQSFFGGK